MQIKTVTFLQVLIFRYDLHCENKSAFQGMQCFSMPKVNEPRCEKTGLRGFRPGLT